MHEIDRVREGAESREDLQHIANEFGSVCNRKDCTLMLKIVKCWWSGNVRE